MVNAQTSTYGQSENSKIHQLTEIASTAEMADRIFMVVSEDA